MFLSFEVQLTPRPLEAPVMRYTDMMLVLVGSVGLDELLLFQLIELRMCASMMRWFNSSDTRSPYILPYSYPQHGPS